MTQSRTTTLLVSHASPTVSVGTDRTSSRPYGETVHAAT
jgi:hypothetical protein